MIFQLLIILLLRHTNLTLSLMLSGRQQHQQSFNDSHTALILEEPEKLYNDLTTKLTDRFKAATAASIRHHYYYYDPLIVTIFYKQCIESCTTMRVLSVNIGLPRQVVFNGQIVTTSIFKDPVKGPIMLRKLNLDGDRQADLTVHGGLDKAVYSYPAEHYEYYWRKQFPNMDLTWGMFGENFNTEGLMEDDVNVGDQFQIGSAAKLIATQPRMPCYKLGVRFGRMDVIRRFMASGRPGIYFKVLQEGQVKAGDKIKIIRKDEYNVTVKDIVRLYIREGYNDEDIETMRRATKIEDLPAGWRHEFEQKIEQLERK